MNNDKLELIQTELEVYRESIQKKPKYHRFLARFYEELKKSEEEIITENETALNISETNDEKLISIEAYLEYLIRIDAKKHFTKIEDLKKRRNEIYDIINSIKTKLSRQQGV